MSLLITSQSVLEASENIVQNGYFKKVVITTIKGKTSCKQKKNLLNFMIMQVLSAEEIPVTTGDCDCLKEEFNFTQSCEEPAIFRVDGAGNYRVDGDGNFRIYQ